MADAKSRYEIVQDLTEQRQRLVDEKSSLDNNLLNLEANIGQEERNFKRQQEQAERNHLDKIVDMQANLEVTKKSYEDRKSKLETKENALTEAIDAIKAISANNEKA